MDKLIKEIEELFGTTAKDNVIYFNDITCNTPIPLPVADAVKVLAQDYPDCGIQVGTYSVKVFDKNVKPSRNPKPIENSVNKEIDSSRAGKTHDEYMIGKITRDEAIKNLEDDGFDNAAEIVGKWGNPVCSSKNIKSSLSEHFPVSGEEAEELDELAMAFTDKGELRSVLEDYFHIYDDYATMSVQEFDRCLADYFENGTNPLGAYEENPEQL